jgi:hypothetical protein
MGERQTCADCHDLSPETETNYTLIGARFRWRLTRIKRDDGTLLVEWRCPACWRRYKESRGEAVPPSTRPGPGVAHPPSGRRRAAPPPSEDDSPTIREVAPRRARSVPPHGARKR